MALNVINPYQTFYDSTGAVRANGWVTFYVNTTSTLGSIYSDEALTVAQTNPYNLDANGRITGDVKFSGLMTIQVSNADGSDVITTDNVTTTDESGLLRADLASTTATKGASLVSFESGETVQDLASTATDTGDKGFHLVKIPPLSGETGVVNYEYPVGDVRRYGAATSETATNNQTYVQAAADACATLVVDIVFDDVQLSIDDTIILTDLNHSFTEKVLGKNGASVTFTNHGTSGDTLANMKHGFRSVTTNATAETGGWNGLIVDGLTIVAPDYGAGMFIANANHGHFENCTFNGGKYGVAVDCCIGFEWDNCAFVENVRAAIGVIDSGNSAVYYSGAQYNDSHSFNNLNISGTLSTFAAIEDHGSASFGTRNISGVSVTGANRPYGYVTRKAVTINFENYWTESILYPIYFISTSESGNLPSTTPAIPSSDFPAGFSYGCHVVSSEFAGATDVITNNGNNGTLFVAGNLVHSCTNFLVDIDDSGIIIDGGNTLLSGTNRSLTFERYTSIAPVYKTMFAHPQYAGGTNTFPSATLGYFAGASIGDATTDGHTHMVFVLPPDYIKYSEIEVRVMSAQTATLRYNALGSFGAVGEVFNTHSMTTGSVDLALTANELTNISLNAAFASNPQAGDMIGVRFEREGSHANDTLTDLYVLGVFMRYQ